MNASDSPDEPQKNELGRIEGLAVPLILGSIHRTGTTGVLHFTKGNVKKSLYIKDGEIIFAVSSDHRDRLGDLLIKKGKVTSRDLEEAVSRLGSGRRLGTILTEDSKMTPEELVENVVDQVKNIVFSIFEWESGFYQYEEGYLPSFEPITLNQSTPEILFQGVRGMSDLKILLRSLGGLKRKFVLDPHHREKAQTCLISDDERKVAEILSAPSSAEEILKSTSLNTLDVIKTLFAMKITGLAREEKSPVCQSFQQDSRIKGDLAERDIIDILCFLARSDSEGTLYLKSELIEAGFFIKDADLVSVYFPEEKMSFLTFLSKKKKGQKDPILEDALSSKEMMEDMIQNEERSLEEKDEEGEGFGLEMLDEILKLQEGEFIFLEGESLPGPGVMIKQPIVTVILHSLEKMDDWPRIEKGCGSADTWLILAPAYLEVIDQMPINNQLWDIISKLKAPCTVKEVASFFQIGKMELCRWLWFMQATGAIKRFEEEEENGPVKGLTDFPELAEHQEAEHEKVEAFQEEERDNAIEAVKTISEEPSLKRAFEQNATIEKSSEKEKSSEAAPCQGDLLKDTPAGTNHFDSDSLDEEWKELIEEKKEKEKTKKKSKASGSTKKGEDKKEGTHVETVAEPDDRPEETMTTVDEEEEEQEIPVDENIVEDIRKFNEKQRYLFEKLKSEMGAGTQNFIHYCQSRMGQGENNPFMDMHLTSGGDWETSSLARRIVKNNIDQYQMEFDKLLNLELDMVENFISSRKKKDFERGIRDIEKRQIKID